MLVYFSLIKPVEETAKREKVAYSNNEWLGLWGLLIVHMVISHVILHLGIVELDRCVVIMFKGVVFQLNWQLCGAVLFEGQVLVCRGGKAVARAHR